MNKLAVKFAIKYRDLELTWKRLQLYLRHEHWCTNHFVFVSTS